MSNGCHPTICGGYRRSVASPRELRAEARSSCSFGCTLPDVRIEERMQVTTASSNIPTNRTSLCAATITQNYNSRRHTHSSRKTNKGERRRLLKLEDPHPLGISLPLHIVNHLGRPGCRPSKQSTFCSRIFEARCSVPALCQRGSNLPRIYFTSASRT